MFYVQYDNQTLNGVPTKIALELKKKGKKIFNRKGKEVTIEEIQDFINSNRKSVYDLAEEQKGV